MKIKIKINFQIKYNSQIYNKIIYKIILQKLNIIYNKIYRLFNIIKTGFFKKYNDFH